MCSSDLAVYFSGVSISGIGSKRVVGDGSRHPTGFRRGLLGGCACDVRKPLAGAMGMTRGITMRGFDRAGVCFGRSRQRTLPSASIVTLEVAVFTVIVSSDASTARPSGFFPFFHGTITVVNEPVPRTRRMCWRSS